MTDQGRPKAQMKAKLTARQGRGSASAQSGGQAAMMESVDCPAVVGPEVDSRAVEATGVDQAVATLPIDELRQRIQRLTSFELSHFMSDTFTEQGLSDEALLQQAKQLVVRLEARPESILRGEMLPSHLVRLCETPLLAPADEYELFAMYNRLKFRATELRERLTAVKTLRNPATVKRVSSQLAIVEQLIDLVGRCENFLVCANARLVISIVKHFVDGRNGFDDLLSDGMMALMRAVQKFDFSRGFRFSTYATMVVRRHVCRQVKLLQKQRTRFVTGALEEVAPEQILDMRASAAGQATSAPVAQQINELLSTLDERERFIIQRRFAFESTPRKQTLSYLAAELGVCKERVRQLEQRALRKLRLLAAEAGLRQLAGI